MRKRNAPAGAAAPGRKRSGCLPARAGRTAHPPARIPAEAGRSAAPAESFPAQNGHPAYQLIRSRRRTISLQIARDGGLIVRAPLRMPAWQIESFVRSKSGWIRSHPPRPAAEPLADAERTRLRTQAKQEIPARTRELAARLHLENAYRRISIRFQRTRWGSCSSRGNLNFNAMLMLAPPRVRDYVIIHELCHLKQMNHSPAFWREVEQAMPDYRSQRAWLRKNGGALLDRLDASSDS